MNPDLQDCEVDFFDFPGTYNLPLPPPPDYPPSPNYYSLQEQLQQQEQQQQQHNYGTQFLSYYDTNNNNNFLQPNNIDFMSYPKINTSIHSIKAFTKLCNLSTPTVMKWLDGQQVYKSSVHKIDLALSKCNITKEDLLKMRRNVKKNKNQKNSKNSNYNNSKNEESYEQKTEKSTYLSNSNSNSSYDNNNFNTIQFVVGHFVEPTVKSNNSILYYQVVYNDMGTGYVKSSEICSAREIKLIQDYWEWKNTFEKNDNV